MRFNPKKASWNSCYIIKTGKCASPPRPISIWWNMHLKDLGLKNILNLLLPHRKWGCSKEKPDIFIKAAERLGLEVGDCVVFEDALHAIKSAKLAGFYTVGVYDKCFESEQESIKNYADQYVRNLSEVELQY